MTCLKSDYGRIEIGHVSMIDVAIPKQMFETWLPGETKKLCFDALKSDYGRIEMGHGMIMMYLGQTLW